MSIYLLLSLSTLLLFNKNEGIDGFTTNPSFARFKNASPFQLGVTSLSKTSSTSFNLYDDANDMLDLSLLMYAHAELRSMAKKGDLSKEFLEIPMTAKRLGELLSDEDNYKNLMESESFNPEKKSENTSVQQEALQSIIKRNNKNKGGGRATVNEFNDDESNEELVYAVTTDPSRKRVTVAFRGSVTPKDFLTDVSWWMRDVKNRMKVFDDSQPDVIRIHTGFHDYLFGQESLNQSEIDRLEAVSKKDLDFVEGDTISKFDEIMNFHVLPLLKENPGYSLYVTGHR